MTSVRSGGLVPKHVKAAEDSWRLHPRISIEDPFEVSYDVGHVLRDSTFRQVRAEAARAYALLAGIHRDGDASQGARACLDEVCREVPPPPSKPAAAEAPAV